MPTRVSERASFAGGGGQWILPSAAFAAADGEFAKCGSTRAPDLRARIQGGIGIGASLKSSSPFGAFMVAFPFRPLRPCDTCLLYWDPPAPRRAYARPHVTALCVITLCKTASCSFGAFAVAPSRV